MKLKRKNPRQSLESALCVLFAFISVRIIQLNIGTRCKLGFGLQPQEGFLLVKH